jgi:site-specific recombinase XerC
MTGTLVPISSPALPGLVTAAGERARVRFLEFFAANIRNPHTRRAYYRAAEEFLAWCASAGVSSIGAVQPVHVATWIEAPTRELAVPSVKQHLAALRHLFDWLVNGQVVPINPAQTVRGPRHVVTSGQTPVLDPAEARALLDSIDVSTQAGLRDRALIGLMVYSFARIGAALGMTVEDVFTQNPVNGCGCARRAASGTRCRATTTSKSTSPPTSTAPASATIPRGRCSARSAAAPAGLPAPSCLRRMPMR